MTRQTIVEHGANTSLDETERKGSTLITIPPVEASFGINIYNFFSCKGMIPPPSRIVNVGLESCWVLCKDLCGKCLCCVGLVAVLWD